MHSTNYYETFITVADACKRTEGTVPPKKEPATVARMKYDMISQNPYKYTSDDVLWMIHCQRKGKTLIQDFFAKGQACFRCSPLSKSYGWGFHFDKDGKVAVYGMETDEYKNFLSDDSQKKKHAFSKKIKTQIVVS